MTAPQAPGAPARAAAYLRTSTPEQRLGLRAQKTSVAGYVTFKAIDLRRRVCEHHSATSTPFLQRPKAAALLAWCRDAGVTHLIIDKVDRAFRDTVDCLQTTRELQGQGFVLHFLDLGFDTTTPMGEAMLTLAATFARLETRRRRERQAAVIREKRGRRHRVSRAAVGWTLVRDGSVDTSVRDRMAGRDRPGCRLVPDPAGQADLRTIIRLWNGGHRSTAIASALNRDGRTTATGKAWRSSSVDSAVATGRLDDGTLLHTHLMNPPAGLAA